MCPNTTWVAARAVVAKEVDWEVVVTVVDWEVAKAVVAKGAEARVAAKGAGTEETCSVGRSPRSQYQRRTERVPRTCV